MIFHTLAWGLVVGGLVGPPALATPGDAASDPGDEQDAQNAFLAASRGVVTVSGRIEHKGPGLPSLVQFRLDPPNAAGGGELLVSISKGQGLVKRGVLQPVAPGVYEFEYIFPEGGVWFLYVRFGPGQAGLVSTPYVHVLLQAGTEDTFGGVFRRGLANVPGYVLPLGYAAFGVIGALALGGVTAILLWLRRQLRPAPRGTA